MTLRWRATWGACWRLRRYPHREREVLRLLHGERDTRLGSCDRHVQRASRPALEHLPVAQEFGRSAGRPDQHSLDVHALGDADVHEWELDSFRGAGAVAQTQRPERLDVLACVLRRDHEHTVVSGLCRVLRLRRREPETVIEDRVGEISELLVAAPGPRRVRDREASRVLLLLKPGFDLDALVLRVLLLAWVGETAAPGARHRRGSNRWASQVAP